MRIKVLGCSGGVGPNLRTTSLLVDDDLLIDAGTGTGDLSLAQMRRIKDVVITHSHLDHICGLAFMADNLFDLIDEPIRVHAAEVTLQAMRDHLFNWKIWPDFSRLPSPEAPLLAWHPLATNHELEVGHGRRVHIFDVEHTVPGVGVAVQGSTGTFVFSGDTCDTPKLWAALNALPRLDLLMIEVAFPEEASAIAVASKHFTPQALGEGLKGLKHNPSLLLTHHKPGTESLIARECQTSLEGWDYHHLESGEIFIL